MPAPAPPLRSAQDEQYADLLGLWSDLEASLHLLLSHPPLVQDLPAKVRQLHQWLQELVAHDGDAALYLMFQLAGQSTIGYSAAHALVCATLCQILGQHCRLPAQEHASLVHAAFTMNIGMTRLQDQLALQRERPSAAQQEAIRQHPQEGRAMLAQLGVTDPLWLDIVAMHHQPLGADVPPLAPSGPPPAQRLARMLSTTDRYAAMISPRSHRAGRTVAESMAVVTGPQSGLFQEVGQALVHCVGLFPPGVFVRLDNGETAIVLRRSVQPLRPLMAALLGRDGQAYAQPRLYHPQDGSPGIAQALASGDLQLRVNHRALVQLGLYTARFNEGALQLLHVPGARL